MDILFSVPGLILVLSIIAVILFIRWIFTDDEDDCTCNCCASLCEEDDDDDEE